MSVWSLINEGVALFKNRKFDKAIEKLNQALDGIEDKIAKFKSKTIFSFILAVAI